MLYCKCHYPTDYFLVCQYMLVLLVCIISVVGWVGGEKLNLQKLPELPSVDSCMPQTKKVNGFYRLELNVLICPYLGHVEASEQDDSPA